MDSISFHFSSFEWSDLMNDPNRREAVRVSASAGFLAVVDPPAPDPGNSEPAKERKTPEKPGDRDRKAVLAAGMTEAEADCWAMAAELAGKFFALPELHPMDKQEIATAIHVIQHRLLSRPTYRKYLEKHKALANEPE
jgi:hypothetical protein